GRQADEPVHGYAAGAGTRRRKPAGAARRLVLLHCRHTRGGCAAVKIRVALSLWVALCAAPAAAQMYKWVDEKGVTHYSEKPPPWRKAQQMQSAPAAPSAAAAFA